MCEHSLQIILQDADILFNLGNMNRQLEENRLAIDCYQQAIQIDPQNPDAY